MISLVGSIDRRSFPEGPLSFPESRPSFCGILPEARATMSAQDTFSVDALASGSASAGRSPTGTTHFHGGLWLVVVDGVWFWVLVATVLWLLPRQFGFVTMVIV